VIVPVRDGEHFLRASLAALRASDLPRSRWELIVADDASQDRSAEVASEYADRVIRIADEAHGPAVARNRGAAVARGRVFAFVDADVSVHRDALRRLVETLEDERDLSAVFGAYDLNPAAPGLVSQYRNLLHHYVHQRDAGEAVTFWAGCGAVRAEVFAACGGFDEAEYAKCSVEDIQLGYRMSESGHRIMLRPEIQGQHLKRWTLRSMVVTDVRGRGVPWVRLLLSRKIRPTATLNLRPSEQVCTVLVVIGGLALVLGLSTGEWTWLAVGLMTLTVILTINAPLLAWFARQRGWWFAVRVVPLRVLYYALNAVSAFLGLLPVDFWRKAPRSRAGQLMVPSRGAPN
jgi:hypothetical protein